MQVTGMLQIWMLKTWMSQDLDHQLLSTTTDKYQSGVWQIVYVWMQVTWMPKIWMSKSWMSKTWMLKSINSVFAADMICVTLTK